MKQSNDARQYWIYLIGNVEHNVFKIGMTLSPTKRLQQLDRTSPVPLSLINRHRLRLAKGFPWRRAAYLVERQVQLDYSNRKLRGEWFKNIHSMDFLNKVLEYEQPFLMEAL